MAAIQFGELKGSGIASPGVDSRGSLHRSRAQLVAIADDDRPFLRIVRKAGTSCELSHYTAAAPLLAAAAGDAARPAGAAPLWDAALISLGLPDLNGIIAISRLKALHPGLKIWASVGIEDPHTLIVAICAGADGYLIKRLSVESFTADFYAFNRDRPPFGARLAATLLKLAGDSVWGPPAPTAVSLPPGLGLSRAQLQLLRLLAHGDTTVTAAGRMALTTADAYKLLHGIYRALHQPLLRTAVPQALRASVRSEYANGYAAAGPILIGRGAA